MSTFHMEAYFLQTRILSTTHLPIGQKVPKFDSQRVHVFPVCSHWGLSQEAMCIGARHWWCNESGQGAVVVVQATTLSEEGVDVVM